MVSHPVRVVGVVSNSNFLLRLLAEGKCQKWDLEMSLSLEELEVKVGVRDEDPALEEITD